MTDNVNHPTYYAEGWSKGAEVIDITENLNFNLGNVVKYVARAGKKTSCPREDLLKAQFYLNRELERLPRQWDLLDSVPPNTIVEDIEGDRYRRIQGTGKFEISYREDTYGQFYEWQAVPDRFYFMTADYSPFTEVTE